MHQSRALQGALGLDNILGTLPQVVFYFLWGNLLASWSFYFSSIMKQARTAGVLLQAYLRLRGQLLALLVRAGVPRASYGAGGLSVC